MFAENNQKTIALSIAIPTYRRHQLLMDTLDSVVSQRPGFDFEVLVLDNECSLDLKTRVESFAQSITVPLRYLSVEAIGLHNGRNTGAQLSSGDIIVYIDDDVIAPQGWLENICQPFLDPAVGGVGGRTLPRWESPPPNWVKALEPSFFSLLDLGSETRAMTESELPYGCNMAFRRDLVVKLGGFPPDGVGGGWIEWRRGDGETGFARKVKQAGHVIMYSAEGWLYHRIPLSRQSFKFIRHRAMKSAVSGSYTKARQHNLSRSELLKDTFSNTKGLIKATIAWVVYSLCPRQARVDREIELVFYSVSLLYTLRLIVDQSLRQWVSQNSYSVIGSTSQMES
ncbi:glycosyltransferase [Nodosilinea sp. E11]|uniref:glycosyltransferase n=1 Tax=Nodosilinea sp. E11 TaxID=3037479 RepID=UPI002934D809|nr:glycosyltransferase [Nodosilinea sp. E11]WOD40830.1 glycosyltransferase [Nodosilinea sp. E11]